MTMATRIVVMKDGLIQQVDTPQNLYDLPCNIFVAGFIGTPQMNFVNGTLVREKNSKDIYFKFNENFTLKVPDSKNEDGQLEDYIGKEVILGVRPELIHDEERYLEQFTDSIINAKVEVTELMGAEIFLYLSMGEETATTEVTNLVSRVSSRCRARTGDDIKMAIDMTRAHIFDKDTEKVIVH
jgi:multiple sugar transport system ATP-binding protein